MSTASGECIFVCSLLLYFGTSLCTRHCGWGLAEMGDRVGAPLRGVAWVGKAFCDSGPTRKLPVSFILPSLWHRFWESHFNQKYAIKTLPSHLFHSSLTKYLWPVTPQILKRCWRLVSAEWRWAFFHFSFLFKNNFYIFLIRETMHAHEIIWKIYNSHQKTNNPTPLRDNNLLIFCYISFRCFIYIYILLFQNWNQALIIVFCFT